MNERSPDQAAIQLTAPFDKNDPGSQHPRDNAALDNDGGNVIEGATFSRLGTAQSGDVGQIVLLPVIGAAVTRGLALPPLGRGDFWGCDNLLGQNPIRATLSL